MAQIIYLNLHGILGEFISLKPKSNHAGSDRNTAVDYDYFEESKLMG